MARSPDHAAVSAARPGFKALVVGLHWPSLPFGDEEIPAQGALLSDDSDAVAVVGQCLFVLGAAVLLVLAWKVRKKHASTPVVG